MQAHQFPTIADAKAFALAGNAVITLQSLKSGVHYTYKVRQATDRKTQQPVAGLYFVNLLTNGSADEGNFTYLGLIRDGALTLTAKSQMTKDSGPIKAFRFFLGLSELHPTLAIRHEGRCGRCGRTLTVPESIDLGIGPECLTKMGGAL